MEAHLAPAWPWRAGVLRPCLWRSPGGSMWGAQRHHGGPLQGVGTSALRAMGLAVRCSTTSHRPV
jgi:hypothetical protein